VKLSPSPLERREKLEQLRALEAGMTIAIARVDAVPLSVDTHDDLEKARAIIARAARTNRP
jgi:3-deoxy-manno-octulosonate cytidylyltransferase (CMP-KDO synthetase)